MDQQNRFHPAVLISCPGCGAEASAEELKGEPDRPFRCDRCRSRNSETIARLSAQGIVEVVNVEATRVPTGDSSDNTADSRKRERGNRAAESKPTQ